MNESLWFTLRNYWFNGIETTWTIYVPFIILGTYILLCFLISMFRGKSEETVFVKTLSSIFLAGIITIILVLISIFGLMNFSVFFGNNFCQMGFLLGLIIVAIFTIIVYAKLCNIGKAKDSNALGLSTTKTEKQVRDQKFKRYTFSLWLWSILFVLPFLVLLIPNKTQQLVSIVLDNSGSMEDNLQQCTNALSTALLPTQKNAEFVFTTIDYTRNNDVIDKAIADANNANISLKQFTLQYFNDIVNQKSFSKLATNTVTYNDAVSLYNAFSQIGISESGSPVYEGIWQNYLLSKELAKKSVYNSKKMIVITDGADNLYYFLNSDNLNTDRLAILHKDIFQQEGIAGETAGKFYNSICFINYGTASDLMFADCSNSITEIYDGIDEQSYFNAFRSILPEMFFDILLLYILIAFSALLSITLLIIRTSKL